MLSIEDFLGSYYFTAVEVLVVSLCATLINLVLQHANDFPTGPISRRNNAIFHKARFWKKYINRYPRPAIDIRRSWCFKFSDRKMKSEVAIPSNPFTMMLPLITNMGVNLFMSLYLGSRPALRLPFEIPHLLKPLFQMSLKAEYDSDKYLMSAMGLFLVLTGCQYVIVQILPMANKHKKFFGSRDNLKQYANFLVTEKHHWELEHADEELLAMIDEKLK